MKQIPETTDEKLKQYSTNSMVCMCKDFRTNNGGSYKIDGVSVCKHQAKFINDNGLVVNPDYDVFWAFNCDVETHYTQQWVKK